MSTPLDAWPNSIARDGYMLVEQVFPPAAVTKLSAELEPILQVPRAETAVRSREGTVYAARNLTRLWPRVADLWRVPPLPQLLSELLGPRFGLVRVLYFDKPPEQSWALPWHKDLTIAVRDNRRPSEHFRKPTRKAGIPHVEAPRALLEAMLSLRLHLDDVTDENGPLRVLPGSHRTGKEMMFDGVPQPVLARRGDVLLMRPLLMHDSPGARPGTTRHRRILHLEFAGWPELPDDYAWNEFIPGLPAA